MLAAVVWFGERSLSALWLLNPKPPRTAGSPVAEKALGVLCMAKHKAIPDLNISIYKKGRVGQVSGQPLQVQQLPVSYTNQSLTAHLAELEAHVTDDRTLITLFLSPSAVMAFALNQSGFQNKPGVVRLTKAPGLPGMASCLEHRARAAWEIAQC